LNAMEVAVAEMQQCADSVRQQHVDREVASAGHKSCRSEEALTCARSRKCEEELEVLWSHVKIREAEMRRVHWSIHGEWCVGPDGPHPELGDPFYWDDEMRAANFDAFPEDVELPADHQLDAQKYWEGAETSQSRLGGDARHEEATSSGHPLFLRPGAPFRGDNTYPPVDLSDDVIEFRRFSVDRFGAYIAQKLLVEEAWEVYNTKLLICASLEETWTLKVPVCDGLQDTLHQQACGHANSNRECASNFGHAYQWSLNTYNNLVVDVQAKEYDRKREWETLHIVTCLLETVYTHVIHAIDSGEPCPTTESQPEQVESEINYCHVVEESMTTNLTINYGTPPVPPPLPPVVEPPCTPTYIWDETGSFSLAIQGIHTQTIEDEDLGNYFTVLSAFGWAGCAAPKACTPCMPTEIVVDELYTGWLECKPHQEHLFPGDRDWDTFKCLTGNQCINADGRCNDVDNCDDGSDEQGCGTSWGIDAVLGYVDCPETVVSDIFFQCAETPAACARIESVCNGINNCPNGEDEQGCSTTGGAAGLTVEAMTGYSATIITSGVAVDDTVFNDRDYTFDSLGSFTGHSYIKMSNEDKNIPSTHVQMKLRLPQPTTLYVSKLDSDNLPWLQAQGWTLNPHLEGVSYSGLSRQTKTTDWATRQVYQSETMEERSHQWHSQDEYQNSVNGHAYDLAHLHESHEDRQDYRGGGAMSGSSQTWESQGQLAQEHYGPGAVWQKTFTAGVVEMRGDGGGAGSYVMFAASPDHQPTPALGSPPMPGHAEYIGCFRDDRDRDMGQTSELALTGRRWNNAATNTFGLCRETCGDSLYMALQWGGECFCANSYSTEEKYEKVLDSECMSQDVSRREPCAPHSYACGGNWANAVYQINNNLGGAMNYQILGYGMANCPAGKTIDTHEECEAAHIALGLEVAPKWAGTHGGIPGLCSTREEDWGGGHHFHFNNAPVGVARADLSPVCKV